MNIEEIIREYMSKIDHMSLATCIDDKPWVSEVHFAYDDELNLYFRSKPDRRHSKEIEKNHNVSGNIVLQHEPKTQKVRAVYFEGSAELLQNVDENDIAYKTYSKRLPAVDDSPVPDRYTCFYKIKVTDYYLFDSIEVNPGQKYHMPWVG